MIDGKRKNEVDAENEDAMDDGSDDDAMPQEK